MADQIHPQDNGYSWQTVTQACQTLGVSERTLRRHIDQGKHETKLEKGRRLVRLSVETAHMTDDPQCDTHPNDALIRQLQSEIHHLRDIVAKRDSQVEQLMTELAESNQRSDTIILQLTKQAEGLSTQLEDLRKRPSGFKRLFRWT